MVRSFQDLISWSQSCVLCCAKSLQPCPALWDPMDSSPPGSSAHGILQARILKWVAISFSKGSSSYEVNLLLCLVQWQVGSLPLAPPRKPPGMTISSCSEKHQIPSWWHHLLKTSRKPFVKWVLNYIELPLHQSLVHWPPPTASSEQSLRAF